MHNHLTKPERYPARGGAGGRSLRSIAKTMQRSPRTISRKSQHNATIDHN